MVKFVKRLFGYKQSTMIRLHKNTIRDVSRICFYEEMKMLDRTDSFTDAARR